MDPNLLAIACFYGPTPLAALMAGFLALSSQSSLKAFAMGFLGTVILATALGAAVDRFLMLGPGRLWLVHLMFSPVVGIPLGVFCAAWVSLRPPPSIRA